MIKCSIRPLRIKALLIYALALNKEVEVAECWNHQEGGGWNIHSRRNSNDWELKEMSYLLGLVDTTHPRGDMENLRRWTLKNEWDILGENVW